MSSLHLALESGYFREAGLAVDIRQSPGPEYTPVLLAGGELDVAFTAISPTVINAVIRGGRLKLVAGREIASPRCGDFGAVYGTRKGFPRGIPDFRLLKGKRIVLRWLGDLGAFALDTELAGVSLSLNAVKLEFMELPQAMAALLGGRVDGLVSTGTLDRYYPVASRLVRSPALGRILPNFQFSFVMFGP